MSFSIRTKLLAIFFQNIFFERFYRLSEGFFRRFQTHFRVFQVYNVIKCSVQKLFYELFSMIAVLVFFIKHV